MKLTDEEIMKLADAYASAYSNYENECNSHDSNLRYLSELKLVRDEDRAALEAALSARQGEQEPYDKTEMNAFVQNLYDQKVREGKHGHYETMFHVVHQAIKRALPVPSVNAQERPALLPPDNDPMVLRMAERISELEAQNAQLLVALKKIATVNAMDYEYQRWAKAAIAAVDREIDLREQNAKTLTNEQIDELWRKSCSLEGFSTAQFVRHFARAAIAAVQSNASTHELNSANSLE